MTQLPVDTGAPYMCMIAKHKLSGFVQCSALVQDQVLNQEAWQHGRLLVVGSEHYIIDHNPPIVDKVAVQHFALHSYFSSLATCSALQAPGGKCILYTVGCSAG